MKEFWLFLKKTWWLFLLLLVAPIIVITIFAIGEFAFNLFDLKAGEWAGLLGAIFGYWGTVLLGVLAFWQNERLNDMNKKLMEDERERTAPVFQFLWRGASSDITFLLANVSNNFANYFDVSDLSFKIFNGADYTTSDLLLKPFNGDDAIFSGTLPLAKVERKDFLAPLANSEITFSGNPIQKLSTDSQIIKMHVDILATDCLGITRNTSVVIVGKKDWKFKYKYIVSEVHSVG